ncbi:unnamed protein product [Schistosoma curassoni]|uniref:Ovule protein n=1 Tax=Schistosoma curassoni TaxID=6186 RepID=A0A183JRY6_9TREM|nr:unnamed protein product [Schistosoma curassoni]
MLRELVLPGGFDLVSPSFTVRDITTRLSEPRPTSCRTEMCIHYEMKKEINSLSIYCIFKA